MKNDVLCWLWFNPIWVAGTVVLWTLPGSKIKCWYFFFHNQFNFWEVYLPIFTLSVGFDLESKFYMTKITDLIDLQFDKALVHQNFNSL
jgi:hypothetical protein